MKAMLAFDGSSSSIAAAEFWSRHFLDADSQLEIFSVLVPPNYPSWGVAAIPATAELEAELTAEMESAQAKLSAEVAQYEWETTTHWARGLPGEQIVKRITGTHPDVTILGARGTTEIARMLLGSVSSHVVRHASCPVLIHRDTDHNRSPDEPLRILIACDGSSSATGAIEFASRLPWRKPPEIELVRVIELVEHFNVDAIQRSGTIWESHVAECQESLHAARTQLEPIAGNISTQLLQDESPAQELIVRARELSADLLIVGHQGRNAVAQFLLGSVAYRLAEHAPCPVCVVR